MWPAGLACLALSGWIGLADFECGLGPVLTSVQMWIKILRSPCRSWALCRSSSSTVYKEVGMGVVTNPRLWGADVPSWLLDYLRCSIIHQTWCYLTKCFNRGGLHIASSDPVQIMRTNFGYHTIPPDTASLHMQSYLKWLSTWKYWSVSVQRGVFRKLQLVMFIAAKFDVWISNRETVIGEFIPPLMLREVTHCLPNFCPATTATWSTGAPTEGGSVVRTPFCSLFRLDVRM